MGQNKINLQRNDSLSANQNAAGLNFVNGSNHPQAHSINLSHRAYHDILHTSNTVDKAISHAVNKGFPPPSPEVRARMIATETQRCAGTYFYNLAKSSGVVR